MLKHIKTGAGQVTKAGYGSGLGGFESHRLQPTGEQTMEAVSVQQQAVKVDDVFVSIWGYSMTIVEFYRVKRVLSERDARRPRGAAAGPGQRGFPRGPHHS